MTMSILLSACGSDDAGSHAAATQATAAESTATVDTDTTATGNVDTKAPAANDYAPRGYSLVFSDEFNGRSLNRDRWCTRFAYSGGAALQVPDAQCSDGYYGTSDFFNDEQQRYVDFNSRNEAAHVLANGVLSLRATKTGADPAAPYQSAMIRSKRTFRPDAWSSFYITARVRMPSVIGTFPAFWLAPVLRADKSTAWPPEIDILEGGLNGGSDTVYLAHLGSKLQNWGGVGVAGGAPATYVAPGYDTTWGNYHATTSLRDRWIEAGVEWSNTQACYYLDGRKILCESTVWQDNQHQIAPPANVILNLAIGGSWAGANGIDDSRMPTSFDIDRIRVYRRSR